jgi:hypothetical protein
VLDTPADLIIAGHLRDPLEDFEGRKPIEKVLGKTEPSVERLPEPLGGRQWTSLKIDPTNGLAFLLIRCPYRFNLFDLTNTVLKCRFHHYSPKNNDANPQTLKINRSASVLF